MRNVGEPVRKPAELQPWYRLVMCWCISWITDSNTGKPNLKKAGEFAVGVTWTAYMWANIVAGKDIGVEMWMAYSGVLLTWSTVNYGLKRNADGRAAVTSGGQP